MALGLTKAQITSMSSIIANGVNGVISWLKKAATGTINAISGSFGYLLATTGAAYVQYEMLANVILVDLLTGGINSASPSGALQTTAFALITAAGLVGVQLGGFAASWLDGLANNTIAVVSQAGKTAYLFIKSKTIDKITYMLNGREIAESQAEFTAKYTIGLSLIHI